MTKLPSIREGQICLVLWCVILEYQGTIKELYKRIQSSIVLSLCSDTLSLEIVTNSINIK